MAHNLEGVQKATETLANKNPAQQMERLAPSKDQFDSVMSAKPANTPTFEVVDRSYAAEADIEKNPIMADGSVTSQNTGSATDEEKKRRQQNQDAGEVEEVDDVGSRKSSVPGTLMDEVSKVSSQVDSISKGRPEQIKAQIKETLAQIKEVKEKLANVQGEIKPSYQTVMKNRLSHIDDNLKIAMNKAGLEYTPAPEVGKTESKNPIHKFLDMLTNSEHQINTMDKTLDSVALRDKISPAKMLAIQMKMNTIGQQMELFTNLLNKALESIKTLMNIQV